MNSILKKIVDEEKPRFDNHSEEDLKLYKMGIKILAAAVGQEFIDIPRMPDENNFTEEGLFYTIPFYDISQLYSSNGQVMILVVYEVENNSRSCPLRIEFKIDSDKDFWLTMFNQVGERIERIDFISHEKNQYYSDVPYREMVTLSELVKKFKAGSFFTGD